MSEAVPLLTEDNGDWVTRWWCTVPDRHEQYTVVSQVWSDDWCVRDIYEIKLAERRA